MEVLPALLVSILGAFATSYFAFRFYAPRVKADLQKEFESRFNERKWETYIDFVDIMYEALESVKAGRIDRDMKKIVRKLNAFVTRLLIVGSDEVVEALSEWMRYSRGAGEEELSSTPEGLVKLMAIVIKMRKDLGYESSKVRPKDLLATFVTDIDEHF